MEVDLRNAPSCRHNRHRYALHYQGMFDGRNTIDIVFHQTSGNVWQRVTLSVIWTRCLRAGEELSWHWADAGRWRCSPEGLH